MPLVAGEQGFGTTSRLLSAMLDLSTGQARARVRDAEQLATRRTLTGEPLPARLPTTASDRPLSGPQLDGKFSADLHVLLAVPKIITVFHGTRPK